MDSPPLALCQVLEEEFLKLHADQSPYHPDPSIAPTTDAEADARVRELWRNVHALPKARRSALCISGGGIRSATSALGVLQGIARHGLLARFDYLSTVSGGGYIGGWLTAWIHHAAETRLHRATDAARGANATAADAARDVAAQLASHGLETRALQRATTPQELCAAACEASEPLERVELDEAATDRLLVPLLRLHMLATAEPPQPKGFFSRRATPPAPKTPQVIVELSMRASRTAVFRDLATPPPGATLDPEAESLHRLRQFSHYLNPQTGMFSADTWTLPATLLRNLLLNWQVLVPALASVLLMPRLGVAIATHASERLLPWMASLAFFLALLGIGRMRFSVPSMGGRQLTEPQFVRSIFAGLFLSFWILTLAWAWWTTPVDALYPRELPGPDFFIGWSVAMHLLPRFRLFHNRKLLRPAMILDAMAGAIGGAVEGGMLWLIACKLFPHPIDSIVLYVCLATPAVLMAFLISTTVYLGLASFWMSDDDREWYARAGGWLLLGATLGTFLNLLVFYGVPLLLKAKVLIASLGGIAGVTTILFGSSAPAGPKSSAKMSLPAMVADLASKLAAPIFACAILLAISTGATWLLGRFHIHDMALHDHEFILVHSLPGVVGAAVLICIAASLIMGFFINVNKFSLHAMYRNRLIRAYLGASRLSSERSPNPFTGFDPLDDICMHEISSHQKPFHVLNLNLNLAGKPGKAWQERKAESFTVSPLHCGSQRIQGETGLRFAGAYRPSDQYASVPQERADTCGITLGTSIAISGAAANPNMGYNSSTLVAFLMTFFNARLGCWLGNPAMRRTYFKGITAIHPTWERTGPRFSLRSLLTEALSEIDDRHPYVNLSDGGHFENLALYEMVARRCHFILALDNGKDNETHETYAFEDLGNAIRKIRVDFGVQIEIDFRPLRDATTHWVKGVIKYSCVDGDVEDGVLVVMKPVMVGDEPADVFNYAQAHPEFPQESTSDQWFSESQFESYRELGYHSTKKLPIHQFLEAIDVRSSEAG